MIYDVFISYRRDGGFETAKHLNDLLVRDGYSVSFDIDTLREGNFDNTLLERIEQCSDFLLIVNKDAFARMLDLDSHPEEDWLRRELAYALQLRKNIIPVLLAGASFPNLLPDDVKEVRSKNGPKYSKDYFDTFYAKLKGFMHALPRCAPASNLGVESPATANLKVKCDLDCVFYLDGEERLQLNADQLQKIPLPPGEYELVFVGAENPADRLVQDFRMPQEDKLLKVSLKGIRDKRLQKEAEVKRIAEEKRLAEENRREEEKRRAEEEARKRAEEEKRREEDRKRAKEQERREEDRKRAEEVKRREEERRRAEEEARKWAEEEAKKYEEARKRAEEEFRRKVDEERRFATSDCEFTVNGVSFKMINVEGGTFQMGATPEQGNFGWDAEKPVHSVTLSSYRIGDTPVTQALWKAVMGNNPSLFKGDNLPVEKVSWDDCQEFIQKLNRLTGKTFRLLTEAEWEYAARGGKHHSPYKYAGSNNINEVAWYDDNSGRETHPVKTKKPNALGIYDMSGNVREWCQDCFEHYSGSAQTDPKGPTSGSHRVLRGGSWNSGNSLCQVASRSLDTNGNRIINSGFRLAL